MPASFLRSVRLFLLRWHRRLGVAVSLLLIWLAVTGIALNHSSDWGLDQATGPGVLQTVYRGDVIAFTSYRAGDIWVSHNGASTLYVQGTEVGYCSQPFAGAVFMGDEIIAACGETLLVVSTGAELIESIDIAYDLEALPDAIGIAAGIDDHHLMLRSGDVSYSVSLDSLALTVFSDAIGAAVWAAPAAHGDDIQSLLEQASFGSGVSWTQMLVDLHSGRILGRLGTTGMDLVAILLILLASSGVWVWTTKPGRFRRKTNAKNR
ncbi:MAG: PepSY domain-containing protein [Halioglobus sp.]